MRIIIVGAGLEGVVSAWYLARDGHDVTVLERREGPALETSFANGGQVSVSHPEPWANPRAPGQILRWLGREDAPLLFRMPAEWARWRWGMAFLRECTPGRTRRNTEAIAHLAAYSLTCLKLLRGEAQLDYDAERRGVLHLFFDRHEFARAPERAAELTRCGLHASVVTRNQCIELEPALSACAGRLMGGLHGQDDESGDAHLFTERLAKRLAAGSVRFQYSTAVSAIRESKGKVAGVVLADPNGVFSEIEADAVVVCAGPWSNQLLAPLGERLPIYPVKGYSVTLPIVDEKRAPHVSLTDETRRIVCSRLGDRLRVAGTAELNGFDMAANPARTAGLLKWVEAHFPGATDTSASENWNGLRPATPNNLPVIGATRTRGLWLNTGHGTLGWTLACGSGAALADLIAGRTPQISGFPFKAAG
ncbi:D-amino acid dehydrogenase [Niveibacterium sp. 24ML]|uniref:D-amino acid dehydrogenase n=1 Tax=Niveibacterium sp. 24ML TaxID=2985512 RepID=UPI00226FE5E9|nr:D-amino acid dehydrogenase [Niveibacterium sp. 24ML]MCX9156832.1 D-amino acid dehydrogenase [Niveibacterium sp. 24ML]